MGSARVQPRAVSSDRELTSTIRHPTGSRTTQHHHIHIDPQRPLTHQSTRFRTGFSSSCPYSPSVLLLSPLPPYRPCSPPLPSLAASPPPSASRHPAPKLRPRQGETVWLTPSIISPISIYPRPIGKRYMGFPPERGGFLIGVGRPFWAQPCITSSPSRGSWAI